LHNILARSCTQQKRLVADRQNSKITQKNHLPDEESSSSIDKPHKVCIVFLKPPIGT
jgi:hypothetical protein